MHIARTPLIASALLGAAISLIAAESYRYLVPSAELRELWSLQEAVEPVLELARTLAPGATDPEALQRLAEDVQRLQEQAARVRSLEIEASIVVFGAWAKGSPPSSPGILHFGDSAPSYLDLETTSGGTQRVHLYNVGLPRITASGADESTIHYRAAAKSGEWPIGESTDDLVALLGGQLMLFSVGSNAFSDKRVGIRRVDVRCFINGAEVVSLVVSREGRHQMPKGKYSSMPFTFKARKPLRDAA